MTTEAVSLSWSSPYKVAPTSRNTKSLPGDKITLPPSALEQLLAASSVTVEASNRPRATFDPFNPYSIAAARQERSQWRETRQQLPYPLTFRLVNPKTGNVVHAGIREFSSDEGEVGLSPFLMTALGLEQEKELESQAISNGSIPTAENLVDLMSDGNAMEKADRIIVQAKELPKGTYVRLRPLEAGYNSEDWKSLLERHLRENYTTLTNGEILAIPGGRDTNVREFRFLIDKFVPNGDGICVVDTDLEVDIEALNEEQARETVKQIMKKSQRMPEAAEGSSTGGILDIWNAVQGQVVEGEYVDYELHSWDRSQGIDVELNIEEGKEIDLFVSPLTARQRARPRCDEHVFGDFTSERRSKRIILPVSNAELEGAEALYISVHAYKPLGVSESSSDCRPIHFSMRVNVFGRSAVVDLSNESDISHNSNEEQCKNCRQWVPSRTMMLHTNFCLRNNVLCPHCETVFKKSSPEWTSHWHCPHDSAHGNRQPTFMKHNHIFHTSVHCSSCSFEASSLPALAIHRTTVCPGKLILCQFCHLTVPQEGDPFNPSADQLLSGLTAHELADGSRTTNCHLCQAIVRLRDLNTHLKHHDLSRRSKPIPRICHNVNCGRTLNGAGKNGDIGQAARIGQGSGNNLGLCSICFGPLYVSMHDPDGRATKRRIERRHISQLIQGCGKDWCTNAFCKSGRVNLGLNKKDEAITIKEAQHMVKPHIDKVTDMQSPMHFCVDEGSQRQRKLAEMMAGEGEYKLEWCIAACEAEKSDLDAARQWLKNWAPRTNEVSN